MKGLLRALGVSAAGAKNFPDRDHSKLDSGSTGSNPIRLAWVR